MKNLIRKYLTPKSLYTRGLLMIILPIIVLQLVIGSLIVSRYFFQMTDQLTKHAIERIEYTYSTSKTWDDFLQQLNVQGFKQVDKFDISTFGTFDITGRRIRTNFIGEFGAPVYINNTSWGVVQIAFTFHDKPLTLSLSRRKLAPINPHQIMLNTTGFAFIMFLLSMLFLRNQTRSLARLSRAAKAFGRGEALEYTPTGALEVRSAGNSFLAMRNRITRQREQRNLLLSGVSHDLRTPLTRMKLSLELCDDAELKSQLAADVSILEQLSESFLSYATNDLKEEFETRNLKDEIESIAQNYPAISHLPKLNYDHRIRPILFRRAIENLLANSQRYATDVHIQFERSKSGLMIYIDDNGKGIPDEKIDEALQAFVRLNPSRPQEREGHAGLGLAIAADAIRQHGGDIALLQSPMGGLRIMITLPKNLTAL